MTNLNVVMINVASHDDGLRVLDRVDSATEAGEITVEDVAMVYKSDNGKVKIHQTSDATAGKGAVKGGGLGLLVGDLRGTAGARCRGRGRTRGNRRQGPRPGISDKLIEQAGRSIESYGAVVFVLADQASTDAITRAHRREGRRRSQGGVRGPRRGRPDLAPRNAQVGQARSRRLTAPVGGERLGRWIRRASSSCGCSGSLRSSARLWEGSSRLRGRCSVGADQGDAA